MTSIGCRRSFLYSVLQIGVSLSRRSVLRIAQRLTAVIIGALLVLNVCQGDNTSPYRPSDLFIANSLLPVINDSG